MDSAPSPSPHPRPSPESGTVATSAPVSVIVRNCAPDDMILAARAAKYGLAQMKGRDAILVYGDDTAPPKVTFYLRRRKCSLVVRKVE